MISHRHQVITGLMFTGLLALATTALASGPSDLEQATQGQLVLRVPVGHQADLADQYGLRIVGQVQGHGNLVLVESPAGMTAEQLQDLLAGDHRIDSMESAALASLPSDNARSWTPDNDVWADVVRTDAATTSCFTRSSVDSAWSGYTHQRAAALIDLPGAHLRSADCGSVTVAVIDTGVDPDHALLADALVPGYDFIRGEAGAASDWSNLDQSTQAILETSLRAFATQSTQAILEGNGEVVMLDASMGPVLDPVLASVLDGSDYPAFFGHGTMVAGLIRLVAPQARIMPLRVFDGEGNGHVFQIIDAIYYAVDHGADVINMSFSMLEASQELREALRYARQHGVIAVAAAGNDGAQAQVYPASLPEAVGVAATTFDDALATFSNHGASLVDVAAPGAGVISTFPGGNFAAGWGTSFSAPLVSGTLALIHDLFTQNDSADQQHRVNALKQGSESLPDFQGDIGSGRLNVEGTLAEAQH